MSDFSPPEEASDGAASEPMDDADRVVLAQVRTLYERADPMPADMVERTMFVLSFADMDTELAELVDTPVLARGDGDETVRTMTFASTELTIMVKISPSSPDRVRIDGWVAPAEGVLVVMQQGEQRRQTRADVDGQFVFEDVPHALTEFFASGSGPTAPKPVRTPAVAL